MLVAVTFAFESTAPLASFTVPDTLPPIPAHELTATSMKSARLQRPARKGRLNSVTRFILEPSSAMCTNLPRFPYESVATESHLAKKNKTPKLSFFGTVGKLRPLRAAPLGSENRFAPP